jgi:hypothetical protein
MAREHKDKSADSACEMNEFIITSLEIKPATPTTHYPHHHQQLPRQLVSTTPQIHITALCQKDKKQTNQPSHWMAVITVAYYRGMARNSLKCCIVCRKIEAAIVWAKK